MKIHLGTEKIKNIENAVVTSGTFDGVHLGHQKILQRVSQVAKEIKGQTVLITYWPHPRLVLKPWDNGLQLLSTFPEKANLLEQHGIDHLVKIPFTHDFSQLSPEEYIQIILKERISTKKLIIGYDHRFGKDRSGGLEELMTFAPKYDFDVEEISRKDIDQIGISSTKTRRALEIGDVATANSFLGRPYSITGIVVHGDKKGRVMGFPTANIQVKETYKLIPKDGVYAVHVHDQYEKWQGMLNIGQRPTFGGDNKTIEVHLFDFNEDLYGKEISLQLIARVRDEKKFNSLVELREQLGKDQIEVQNILNRL